MPDGLVESYVPPELDPAEPHSRKKGAGLHEHLRKVFCSTGAQRQGLQGRLPCCWWWPSWRPGAAHPALDAGRSIPTIAVALTVMMVVAYMLATAGLRRISFGAAAHPR